MGHFHKAGLFLLVVSVSLSDAASYLEDTTLSANQAKILVEFKNRVVPKLKRDYEKEDLYLVQFLRAKKFDLEEAERFILKESRWRSELNFDSIHSEDWSDMECCYPILVQGVDREGRPLALFDIGEWDIRRAALAGKSGRLIRWVLKNYDMARIRMRELGSEGKNVTRYNLLFDFKGFLPTNVNSATLPFYVSAATSVDHFPNMVNKIIAVNTPFIFQTIIQAMTPLMSPAVRDSLKFYGSRREDWVPKIRELIDPVQIPSRYGGYKEDINY